MSEWQPIETAPAMSHVLLWYPKGQHVVGLVNRGEHIEAVGYWGSDEPTHWMPLPDSPQ